MTLRKIHKRASVGVAALNKRQAGVTLTSTTPAANPTTTNRSTVSHGIPMPTGPPMTTVPSPTTTTTPVTPTTGPAVTSPTTTGTGTATTLPTTTGAPNTTVPTTPPAAATTRPTNSEAVVTRSVTSRVSTTSTRTSATATATSDESDGMSLGSIAGAAAGVILGVGVITAFIIWFIRRRKRNRDLDEEPFNQPFNRNSFLRQSAAIPDDDGPVPSRTRPPHAPSMVERQPTPLYGAPSPYNDMGNDGFGYNTQPSYNGAPGQMYNGGFGPGGAPATPLPNTPGFGTAYDQGFNNGGYAELTRGNTPHDYPPSPHVYEQYNHHLESPAAPSFGGREAFPSPPPTAHGGETPGQNTYNKSGPNYPELTPPTATAQQGQVVTVKESAHDGRETPVQLGFAPAQSQTQAPTQTGKKQRPESSMYNEDDAYGGM